MRTSLFHILFMLIAIFILKNQFFYEIYKYYIYQVTLSHYQNILSSDDYLSLYKYSKRTLSPIK